MTNAEKVSSQFDEIMEMVDAYAHCRDVEESHVMMARLAFELMSLRRMTLYVEAEEEFFDEFVED